MPWEYNLIPSSVQLYVECNPIQKINDVRLHFVPS